MDFAALIEHCAPSVHPATMAAIARVESGFNPWAIGINGRVRITRQPLTKGEAVDTAKQLLQMPISIDLGLAQINSANLGKLGLTVEQALEPCANLRAAEMVLRWCYDPAAKRMGRGQPALQVALSCYNTGSYGKGLANGYVQAIYRTARASLVTPRAIRITGKVEEGDPTIRSPPDPCASPRAAADDSSDPLFCDSSNHGATNP